MPGWNYYSGANVVIHVAGMPILECVGFSLSGGESSKRPLYGYSSVLFDGVARGQALYYGDLLINYVHQDYLYHAIKQGEAGAYGSVPSPVPARLPSQVPQTSTPASAKLGAGALNGVGGGDPSAIANSTSDGVLSLQQAEALKQDFWATQDASLNSSLLTETRATIDPTLLPGGIDIKVVFGQQDSSLRRNGDTGTLLSGVHFTERGTQIQISEDVIVERYSFFARSVSSIRNAYSASRYDNGTDPRTVVTTKD